MQNDFPLGQIWYRLMLRFSGNVVVTGSNGIWAAFANPVLELLNNIQLKTDVDGNVINAPAKALYLLAANKYGTLPRIDNGSFDPQVAGTYPMSVSIPIDFRDQRMVRPEDTALFSGRYSRVDLYATLGAALDVIKTAGANSTFALSGWTMDVELEKIAFDEASLPRFLPRFEIEESYKVTTAGTIINIGRAFDKALKRVYVFCSSLGATVSPSKNYQGDGSNSVITKLGFKDENKYYDITRFDEAILDEMKIDRGWDENIPAGQYVLDYVKDGMNESALSTGDKGTLQVEYEADGAAPAGVNIITACTESLIMLK
jgi:hypothetical protein